MSERKNKPTALFSLDDTARAVQFARQLIDAGWDIIGSKETVALLQDSGLRVRDVGDFVGIKEDYVFPPTLHAKMEYALTSSACAEPIDLVYVIPYLSSKGNDVGGRTLLALAVKGGRIAVTSVDDMIATVNQIVKTGTVSADWRRIMADKACHEIACHYFSLISDNEKYDAIFGTFVQNLKNGENPYQTPAAVFTLMAGNDHLSLLNFIQLSGETPCFTNLADADCILHAICLLSEAIDLNLGNKPFICVAAKHGNACGMGVSFDSPAVAIEKALFGNPRSIWGGEVITNFDIDEFLSELLLKSERRKKILDNEFWMLDVVMAPSFTPAAVSRLGRRQQRKLLANESLLSPKLKRDGFNYRMIRGGVLRQPPASYILDARIQLSDGGFSREQLTSLIIAWAAVFSSNFGGNEVALAKDGALLAAGGGPSTAEAAVTAVERAKECGHDTGEAIFAADAFFPFTDAPAILCKSGVSAGCVPSGGKNAQEVHDFFATQGVNVILLPEQYRGFCRH